MTVTLQRRLAIAAGLLVLVVGVIYATSRPVTYQSRASVLLVPASADAGVAATMLDSIERAGTMGTYAQLIASRNTLDRAGETGVVVDTRPVPASRVIEVTARGRQADARGSLVAVLAAAAQLPAIARDGWQLEVIENPSPDAPAGPGIAVLLLAVMAAAALAALASLTLLGALRRAAWHALDTERSAPEHVSAAANAQPPAMRVAGRMAP